MPAIDPENLITISEAAEEVGCSRTTVYRALEDGRLHGVEVGDRQMVVRDEAFSAFEPEFTGFRREKYEDGGRDSTE
jgi:excisionase family DNA binding protein